MEQAAGEATQYQRQCCAIREKEARDAMIKQGVTIVDNVDKVEWSSAMSPVYEDKKLMKKYGKWLDKINGFFN